ncbi:hypothetical protein CVT25_010281 [Psilocybe cyanescens]|uniref:Uncharacterized protein n=1 Tax=Psilocybe cyanescens TaxID=93625 RepID=A0A409X2U6_PSICY|nr:hypothetical protein CVT25_010281 [Psilocybe cyanescens]
MAISVSVLGDTGSVSVPPSVPPPAPVSAPVVVSDVPNLMDDDNNEDG